MPNKVRRDGFTLIEIVIALALASILAALAIPAYQTAVMRSNRTLARGTLADLASRQERYFLEHARYAPDFSGLVGGRAGATNFYLNRRLEASGTLDGRGPSIYRIELLEPGAKRFRLAAVAIGDQGKDHDCQRLTLSSSGLRSATADAGGDSSACW